MHSHITSPDSRFSGHLDPFIELPMVWAEFVDNAELSQSSQELLKEIEERDCLFAEIDRICGRSGKVCFETK
jgi:hypothetical protein